MKITKSKLCDKMFAPVLSALINSSTVVAVNMSSFPTVGKVVALKIVAVSFNGNETNVEFPAGN